MPDKLDVKQGTLALMILKTLESLGALHGYGIARRIEETSGHRLSLNYGTLYPALLKLEQEGAIADFERLGDVVVRQDDRRSLGRALTEEFAQPLGARRVDACKGLVAHQDFGPADESAGELETAALAS